MSQAGLESYVKEHFDLPLVEFMKQKVESDTLCDHEIAPLLKVSVSSVRKIRCAFGIEKANSFIRRFEGKYGVRALETFKKLAEDPNHSLADVARRFSFSREYARQVYKKIYGSPYSALLKRKSAERKKIRLMEKWKKTKQAEDLKAIMARIKSIGVAPEIISRGREHIIFANQQKLIVRTTSKPAMLHNREYFRINIKSCRDAGCDFFICICRNGRDNTHFVIPAGAMPGSVISLLPCASPERSKYAQFREAWHLIGAQN